MKLCAIEGCNNEIQVWETFCQQHHEQFVAQQQVPQQQTQQAPVQQAPQPPSQGLPELPKMPEAPNEPKNPAVQEPKKIKQDISKIPVEDKPVLPELPEKERLDCRKVAFSGAINVVATQDTGAFEPDEIVNQISELTDMFYGLIVRK